MDGRRLAVRARCVRDFVRRKPSGAPELHDDAKANGPELQDKAGDAKGGDAKADVKAHVEAGVKAEADDAWLEDPRS